MTGGVLVWLGVAAAGGSGAAARFLVDHQVTARVTGVVPWGTLLVNVTGSLTAGVVAALVASGLLPAAAGPVVAGGFLGAYTTFSTAMYEAVRLLEDGRRGVGAGSLLGELVVSVAAATLGWVVVAA